MNEEENDMRRVRLIALVTACAPALVAGGARGGQDGSADPGLAIRWWVNGELVGASNPAGFQAGNGVWLYQGTGWDPASGIALSFSIAADPDPFVSVGLAVENSGAQPGEVAFSIVLPVSPEIPDASLVSGSAAIGLTTDSAGGSVSTIGKDPLWQGLLDGTPFQGLFGAPFSLEHEALGGSGSSGAFGLPDPVPGPPVLEEISVSVGFRLTPNDQASLTSVFFVVAEPETAGNEPGLTRQRSIDTLPEPRPGTYRPPPGRAPGLVSGPPGDLDFDGDVDSVDLGSILGGWGACPPSGACAGDLDGNGAVGTRDLLILLATWG